MGTPKLTHDHAEEERLPIVVVVLNYPAVFKETSEGHRVLCISRVIIA
jgi:hypothetical protein